MVTFLLSFFSKSHTMSGNETSAGPTSRIATSNVFLFVLLLITFVVGLVVNNLYLWVLHFRMSKTVNSTWFFHYIMANQVFTLALPFLAVQMLFHPHWILGLAMCKLINTSASVSMFGAVFVLTAISIDRYMLVFHPHWYRRHMKPRYATIICIIFWGFAILCSSPYLVFRQLKGNTTIQCYNNFNLSAKWETSQSQLQWSLFTFRFLVGFLLPLSIMLFCYVRIAWRIKKEKLVNSTKPYKIILFATVSFFICWFPYHLWYGMNVEKDRFGNKLMGALRIFSFCCTSFNFCFTPIFYLFIVESFKKVFKKSTLTLIESPCPHVYSSIHRAPTFLPVFSEFPSS
uniref:Probable G-protein coupled receptor 33 n=1 Tax=Leptobrachium leishanense TaxID=445787 RepID=A0A8C5QDZ3_9ANUR